MLRMIKGRVISTRFNEDHNVMIRIQVELSGPSLKDLIQALKPFSSSEPSGVFRVSSSDTIAELEFRGNSSFVASSAIVLKPSIAAQKRILSRNNAFESVDMMGWQLAHNNGSSAETGIDSCMVLSAAQGIFLNFFDVDDVSVLSEEVCGRLASLLMDAGRKTTSQSTLNDCRSAVIEHAWETLSRTEESAERQLLSRALETVMSDSPLTEGTKASLNSDSGKLLCECAALFLREGCKRLSSPVETLRTAWTLFTSDLNKNSEKEQSALLTYSTVLSKWGLVDLTVVFPADAHMSITYQAFHARVDRVVMLCHRGAHWEAVGSVQSSTAHPMIEQSTWDMHRVYALRHNALKNVFQMEENFLKSQVNNKKNKHVSSVPVTSPKTPLVSSVQATTTLDSNGSRPASSTVSSQEKQKASSVPVTVAPLVTTAPGTVPSTSALSYLQILTGNKNRRQSPAAESHKQRFDPARQLFGAMVRSGWDASEVSAKLRYATSRNFRDFRLIAASIASRGYICAGGCHCLNYKVCRATVHVASWSELLERAPATAKVPPMDENPFSLQSMVAQGNAFSISQSIMELTKIKRRQRRRQRRIRLRAALREKKANAVQTQVATQVSLTSAPEESQPHRKKQVVTQVATASPTSTSQPQRKKQVTTGTQALTTAVQSTSQVNRKKQMATSTQAPTPVQTTSEVGETNDVLTNVSLSPRSVSRSPSPVSVASMSSSRSSSPTVSDEASISGSSLNSH